MDTQFYLNDAGELFRPNGKRVTIKKFTTIRYATEWMWHMGFGNVSVERREIAPATETRGSDLHVEATDANRAILAAVPEAKEAAYTFVSRDGKLCWRLPVSFAPLFNAA